MDEPSSTPASSLPRSPRAAAPPPGAGAPAGPTRPPRLWATVLAGLGPAAILALPIGALGSRWGVWHYTRGLAIIGAGLALALVACLGSVIGLLLARRRDLSRDLSRIRFAGATGLATFVLLGIQPGGDPFAPPIHDISTDFTNPPELIALREHRGEDANPLVRTAAMDAMQIEAYPWVQPLVLEAEPDAVFEAAAFLAEEMGLDIVSRSPLRGVIEAVATTFWFGFKDDVVIRVRGDAGMTTVDVRSVSRVGRSDLGTNADRIGEFLERLAESVPP